MLKIYLGVLLETVPNLLENLQVAAVDIMNPPTLSFIMACFHFVSSICYKPMISAKVDFVRLS